MRNRQTLLSILMVALALGTAWAVRGKFGHEQGAAWAGAVGALAVVMAAKRNDWYNKVFKIAFAGAIGWGLSGMMSYGELVGYGRGTDFGNVYYGLLMLFVLGVLYGFLGGGLTGLALTGSCEQKVDWITLVSAMVAFAWLTYGLLINQLEWLMTPPRSELWAACLGASIALAWYLVRHHHTNVLKVAVCSAIGAGFGFAFGNFLQVLGDSFSVKFINLWNVMEYSIGFGGGAGMAYGIFTSEWIVSNDTHAKTSSLFPLLFITAFIPFVVWDQSFTQHRLEFLLEPGGAADTVFAFRMIALVSVVSLVVIMMIKYYRTTYDFSATRSIFIIYLGVYTFLSFLLTGIFIHPGEQYLYIVNIAAILFIVPSVKDNFTIGQESLLVWCKAAVWIAIVITVLAFILIHAHGELSGTRVRFLK